MHHSTCVIIISDGLTNFSQVEVQLPKYLLLKHQSVSNVMYNNYFERKCIFSSCIFSYQSGVDNSFDNNFKVIVGNLLPC